MQISLEFNDIIYIKYRNRAGILDHLPVNLRFAIREN